MLCDALVYCSASKSHHGSLLEPSLGGNGSPFAGWVTSAERGAHCSLPRNAPARLFTGGPTLTPRAGERCLQPWDALQCLVPPPALQPGPVGGRKMAARAGTQKEKHSWGSQDSLGGVLISCAWLLELVEHSELTRYHPRVIRPAWSWVPHVPRQSLTAPRQGRRHSRGGTHLPWCSASALPLPSSLPWQLCARQSPGSTGGSAPPRDMDTHSTFGASSHPSPPPSHPHGRWTTPGWRGTCTTMPASPSEVSAAHYPLPCRLPPGPCPPQGLCSSSRQPASFPRVLSLLSDFALGLAGPWVTHLGPFAQQVPRHACVSLHIPTTVQCMLACTLYLCAGLHTSSTRSCRLAPIVCTPTHTHRCSPTGCGPVDCPGWRDGRRGAAGRGWGWQGCAPGLLSSDQAVRLGLVWLQEQGQEREGTLWAAEP